MSSLIPFSFESHSIRAFNIDGNPWFVGKDACDVLGYKDTVNALKQHCRGVVKYHPIVDSLGRTQEVRIINEPDIYRLITGSHLPEAERFEKWLFEEVLPSIRKTGSYSLPGTQPARDPLQGKVLVDYATLARLTRILWAAQGLLEGVESLARELEKQCGKPLINPSAPRPAPVIPDWQRILKTVLREIETGKYPFPHAFRTIDGIPCVLVRTAQIMAHLRTTPRLRSFFDGLMSKSDRVLKRQLRDAGLILRARTNPTVAGQSLHHAVAIKLEGFQQRRLALN